MNVLLVSWGLLFSCCFVFSVSGSHLDSCELVALNGGNYNCSDTADGGEQCDISCYGVYQGRFYCYPGRGWDRPLPPCVKPRSASSGTAADSCDLVVIGNGNYTCSNTADGGKQCDIYCNGVYQGRFKCIPGKGWDRPLPPCVKPSQNGCGPNSKFSTCITCEKTCRNTRPQALGCGQVCTVGCACDDGFIKDDYGNCIRPNQCSGIGTAASNCDLVAINGGSYSCINTADGGKQCDIYCNGVYQGRFKCIPGKGWTPPLPPCVKPSQNGCGPNSKFSTCITCEKTCRNTRPQALGCGQVCTVGCACDDGFIKDDYGNCIRPNQCSGIGTSASNCDLVATNGGSYSCINTADGGKQCDIYCNGVYQGRFKCIPGKGWTPPLPPCVRPKNQNVCGPNSRYSTCVFCEPTCRNPKPEVCAQGCGEGCECVEGFIKDDFGNCIPKNQCPAPTGGSSCKLVAKDGNYECINDSNGTQCNIYCKGEYKGRYYCTRQGGWKPLPLPYCVTPE